MIFFRKIFAALALLVLTQTAFSQSALYFQGDKETGIYVKVEGKMMERQSKDFIIVPGLEAGLANFEVLFEQNKYPPQNFKIRIPENAVRGFVVSRRSDGSIALFDVQTNGYITANNTEDDAFIPISPKKKTFYGSGSQEKNSGASELPPFQVSESTTASNSEEKSNARSRFIDDLDLNQQKGNEPNTSKEKQNRTIMNGEELFSTEDDGVVKGKNVAPPDVSSQPSSLLHQNCESAMTATQFEWYAKNAVTGDDETKLKYLKRSYQKYCFSTEQVGFLASLLDGQSSRFEWVQIVKDRTVDVENYSVLEGLFSTDFLKKKFRELIKD